MGSTIASYLPSGGTSTTSSGYTAQQPSFASFLGGGGIGSVPGILGDILKARLQAAQQDRLFALDKIGRGSGQYGYGERVEGGVGGGSASPQARSNAQAASGGDETPANSIGQKMAFENLRQKMIADQAADAPPPTKLLSGPGIIPGQVIDPSQMNAFQRADYLPKDNRATNVGGDPSSDDGWYARKDAEEEKANSDAGGA